MDIVFGARLNRDRGRANCQRHHSRLNLALAPPPLARLYLAPDAAAGPIEPGPLCRSAELPTAHAPGIHVDELRARVVTDAAAAERERGFAYIGEVAPGDADVDRAPFKVQAVPGHAIAALGQFAVD